MTYEPCCLFNHLCGLYRFVGSLRSFFRSADFMK